MNGERSMTFRIYSQESGGTPKWSETQTVQVTNGVFTTLLGSVNSIPANVFSDEDAWLEVEVAGQILAGRQRLVSVAYTFFIDSVRVCANFTMLDRI